MNTSWTPGETPRLGHTEANGVKLKKRSNNSSTRVKTWARNSDGRRVPLLQGGSRRFDAYRAYSQAKAPALIWCPGNVFTGELT